jgi:hypothetical protein
MESCLCKFSDGELGIEISSVGIDAETGWVSCRLFGVSICARREVKVVNRDNVGEVWIL